jgi:hypothetical protein
MRQLVLSTLLLGSLASSAAGQSAADVHVPPIEMATSFTYDLHRDGTADLPGGLGAMVTVAANINPYVAILTQASGSPRMDTVMAGARVGTGFYRDGAGGPGRFFAALLAGPRHGGVAGSGAVIQLGAGADALIVPRGLSLHLALDYLFTPGARHDFAGGRVSIGVVAGPRRK